MLTIREEIKKNEQKSDKTYNVKLRFTLNKKYKRISTSLFVTPKDLTKEFKIKASSPAIRNAFKNLLILFSVWLFILLFLSLFSLFYVYFLLYC